MSKFGKLLTLWKRFARDRRGNAAVEYVTIASGIAVFATVAITLAGTDLSDTFTSVSDAIQGTSSDAVDSADSGSSSSSSYSSSDNDSDSDFGDHSSHWS